MKNEIWPDNVRLYMIEKSEFYPDDKRVYQYGFYDGYQYAQNEITELKLMLEQAENAAGEQEQRARQVEKELREVNKAYEGLDI